MRPSLKLHAKPRRSWIWHSAVALCLLVQCWIAGAPLAEHGEGMSAHVESTGAHGHFTHDESSCAACVVLALRAAPPAVDRFVLVPALAAVQPPAVELVAVGQTAPIQRSRAPPAI
jgi:hypothetical protein